LLFLSDCHYCRAAFPAAARDSDFERARAKTRRCAQMRAQRRRRAINRRMMRAASAQALAAGCQQPRYDARDAPP